jgi:Ca-activated chloride channel family protein
MPREEMRRDVLAKLWARARIDELMRLDYNGIQAGTPRIEISEEITQIGLDFRLMTQFTSFVAVEEMTITDGGEPRKVEVPVEMPEGVSHEGVFGESEKQESRGSITVARSKSLNMGAGRSGGMGSGSGAGVGYGRGSAGSGTGGAPLPSTAPKPAAPSQAQLPPVATQQQPVAADKSDSPSPEDQKRRQLYSKLHPSIVRLIERLRTNSAPSSDEARFVRNGKAEIQIMLADKSKETIAALRNLGFEIVLDPKSANMLIGRVAIEKLSALAEIKAVRYVSPVS